MINESVSISLPGLGLAPVVLPAFAVAYATTTMEDGSVRIDVALKQPSDPTFMAAVQRARSEYPERHWIRTAGARSGGGSMGHPDPYWSAVIGREQDGTVALKTAAGDPISDAYRTFSDRAATPGKGVSELVRMLERMEDAEEDKPSEGFGSSLGD